MVRAKKSLGQNFLADESVVERIIDALGPQPDETVIEIGPGRGALTNRLAGRAGRLVAVEYDRDLAALLRGRFGARTDCTVVEADALAVDYCEIIWPVATARVVANLPYNVSTAILQRLIAQRACCPELILMLQREVVERITAPPCTGERGYLSVFVEAYCEAEALFDVAPGSFRPVPKVWSTVVRLRARPSAPFDFGDEAVLWQLVSAGFAQRRKTITNNLRASTPELRARVEACGGPGALLETAHVEPTRRAETLTLEDWARLARALTSAAAA